MRTKRIFIVTGAYGFLGNTLCRMLSERKETVRALVLTGETCPAFDGFDNITVYQGDVCKKETLEELFVADDCCELYLIHTAAVVSIDSVAHELTRRVNLEGARNIAELALKHHVTKMVYVSSVHAIPENPVPQLIEETNQSQRSCGRLC
ncbi:MAG: NAD-dependent epimerase/dehydratase family protein [Oscillospiraceae bacterium]